MSVKSMCTLTIEVSISIHLLHLCVPFYLEMFQNHAFVAKVRTILKLLVPMRTIFTEAGYLPDINMHVTEWNDRGKMLPMLLP